MSTPLRETLDQRLRDLERQGRRRTRRVIEPGGPRVLCSNDYLGVASRGLLVDTAIEAATNAATGSGASRLISGTSPEHAALEARLAAWLQRPAALWFATGYQANVGLMSGLLTPDDAVFSDALNHASIIDGIRLSGARRHVYRHRDVAHLDELLRADTGGGLRVIVSDSVFSMDGDLAPVADLVDVARRHGAVLVLDEAHAIGVLGPAGRGLAASLGLEADVDVIVGTCGKAMGTAGAFVAGSPELAEWLYNRARSFVFSTAPPPSLARTTRHAISLLEDGALQAELWHNVRHFAALLRARGWWHGEPLSTIFPLVLGPEQDAVRLSEALLERGWFVHPIRPPTVPPGTSRLRIIITAAEDTATLDALDADLADAAASLDLAPRSWSHEQAGQER